MDPNPSAPDAPKSDENNLPASDAASPLVEPQPVSPPEVSAPEDSSPAPAGSPAAAPPAAAPATFEPQVITPSAPPETQSASSASDVPAASSAPAEPAATPVVTTTPISSDTSGTPQTPGVVVGSVTPLASGGGVSAPGGPQASPTEDKPKKRWLNKWLVIAAAAVVVLGGGGAAAYFGYYMSPSVIWSQGMSHSATALGDLTDYAQKLQAKPPGKGLKIDGTAKVVASGVTVDGTLHSINYGQNANVSASFNTGVAQIGLNVRAVDVSGDNNPDLYFQATGFKSLADLAQQSQYGKLDGQWIAVNHALLDDIEGAQKSSSNSTLKGFTGQNVMGLVSSMSKTTQQYVFTTDSKKAVMKVAQKVGKETMDGQSVYHYKVSFDKTNLKSYVEALGNDAANSQLGKSLAQSTGTPADQLFNTTDMVKSVDRIPSNYKADVWVTTDSKRLVHKIRFPDQLDPLNNFVDIGQNYKGGDSYSLLFGVQSKSGQETTTFNTVADIDQKTNTTTLHLQLKTTGGGSDMTGNIDVTLAPNNQPVNVTVPKGAKSLADVADELGLGDSYKQLTSQSLLNQIPTSSL